jgi:hypothetical protein
MVLELLILLALMIGNRMAFRNIYADLKKVNNKMALCSKECVALFELLGLIEFIELLVSIELHELIR